MQDYIHLHVHSQYSILDGQASIPALVEKAIKDGMKGMALTDHGNMMGVKEFFNYVQGKKSKATKELKAIEEKLSLLEAHTYLNTLTRNHLDYGKSEEELKEKYTQEKKKQEAILQFKPIFGCEMYVARNGLEKKESKEDSSGWHLVVLAKNKQGYHNLLKLVSKGWTHGFYNRPRTDKKELLKYKEGLIISTACLGGELPKKIMNGKLEEAEEALLWFKSNWGEDFYLELQRHEVTKSSILANRDVFPLQNMVNKTLIALSEKHQVKLICTNDVHFVDEENAEAHDRLICLSTGKDLDDPKRMLYTKQEWFKTKQEMWLIFNDLPQALANTLDIWEKVEEYSIDHAPIMPNFQIPESFGTEEAYRQKYSHEDLYVEFAGDEKGNVTISKEEGEKKIKKLGGYDKLYRLKLEGDYLAKLAFEGAVKRYGDNLSEEIKERLCFELHIMKTMGFPGYFLIVQDYIRVAREQLNVFVGPGRGSAAGSVVAYCLWITQIDPIKYDLLFERFLNPDRISLPDIDIDFDDDGRSAVLNWVTDTYGEDKVAHIITYGSMATKMALKDVARVQRVPLDISNKLCKAIPDTLPEGSNGKPLKMNLTNVISCVPELREAENSTNIQLRDTIKYAKMLEGNIRGTGVHACGVIICKDPISDWVPVSTATDKETGEKFICTQYEGKVIEETGLIKMDFLGLKTLSIIKESLENIKESLGISIDIDNIPLDDAPTYKLYSEGKTIGTFQFESPGMRKYLIELQPTTFEDLIAMNALYRPGPMAYIPQFIARKHGKEPITYDLPCMEKYLKDTYGITVYQEQVMLLSRVIANFTRGESDNLRKAMGKKLVDKLEKMEPQFLAGGKANGYEEKTLKKIWEDWKAFASYAFNKSHATCYSWVAYQTAYLKANYPAQYMAGVMSRNLSNITEITKLMDECKAMGINTFGPDINESNFKFGVNAKGEIRFGLVAIKGVGEGAVAEILRERKENGPFKNIYDFVERVNLSTCNRKNIENLAYAGAFDSLGIPRDSFFAQTEKEESFLKDLMKYGTLFQTDAQNNQVSLFGEVEEIEIAKPEIPKDYVTWSNLEKLNKEKEYIGIYLSAHPLDDYELILRKVGNANTSQLNDLTPLANKVLTFGGMVAQIKEGRTRKGNPFGIVTLEDYEGTIEIPFWGEDWATWRNYFVLESSVWITAQVTEKRWEAGMYELKVQKVDYLSEVKDRLLEKITLFVTREKIESMFFVEELLTQINNNEGDVQLQLCVMDPQESMRIELLAQKKRINLNRAFMQFIEEAQLQYQIN